MQSISRRLGSVFALTALTIALMGLIGAGVAAADSYRAAVNPHTINFAGLRWWVVIVQIATIPVGATMIGLSATLRDRATLERLFGIREKGVRPAGARVSDITAELRSVRRRGLMREGGMESARPFFL